MDILERRSELKKSILTLEWDKNLRQINFSKNSLLEDYKKELAEIEAGLKVEDGQII